jgi:hypothetical protein
VIATRVAARIRRATGIEAPIRTTFDGSTVAALAEVLEGLLIETLEGLTGEEALELLADVESF